MHSEITALVLTFNEKENLARTLSALPPVAEIVLIDSFSTDGTADIAKAEGPRVRVVQREFDSFAGQCNFGLDQIKTGWVLSLDADYILSPELRAEIAALNPPADVSGYSVEFVYSVYGHPLRASAYPPRTVLYRKDKARYRDEGHGHRVVIDGKVEKLRGKIYHDDRKPLSHWIQAQDRYAILEAKHLLQTLKREKAEKLKLRGGEGGELGNAERGSRIAEDEFKDVSVSDFSVSLSIQDRLRLKIFLAAPAMFFYLLFGKGLILDGWPGWMYVAQRTVAELLLSMRLLIEREKLER